MVLQDKYKRATSRRYRALHGGIQSNQQRAAKEKGKETSSKDQPTPGGAQLSGGGLKDGPSKGSDGEEGDGAEQSRYRRRDLGSNLSRYEEPEPDPLAEPEPELDLTEFIAKQKSKLSTPTAYYSQKHRKQKQGDGGDRGDDDNDDVDRAFDHLFKHALPSRRNRSPSLSHQPVQHIVCDPSSLGLEELELERKKTDATRELLARFTGRNDVPMTSNTRQKPLDCAPDSLSNRSTHPSLSSKLTAEHLRPPLSDDEFLDEVLNDSSGTYGQVKKSTRLKP